MKNEMESLTQLTLEKMISLYKLGTAMKQYADLGQSANVVKCYCEFIDRYGNDEGLGDLILAAMISNVNDAKNSKEVYNITKTYVVYNPHTDLYKIGKTTKNTVPDRVKQLDGGGQHLQILFIFEQDIELQLHKRFKKFRKFGEWFKLSELHLKKIENLHKSYSVLQD